MTRSKAFLVGYKVFFGLLGFSAIVTEIATLVERGNFNPVNFFSYFTIQTNILVCAMFLLSALALAAGKHRQLAALRSAVTVYILIVGIGFSLLLSTIEGLILTAVPWDNIVLHYIIPIAVLVDFLIDRPSGVPTFTRALYWLLFPLAYAVYAFLRGAISGWYPYPFLDPRIDGLGVVASTAIGLLALGVILVWLITWLASHKKFLRI